MRMSKTYLIFLSMFMLLITVVRANYTGDYTAGDVPKIAADLIVGIPAQLVITRMINLVEMIAVIYIFASLLIAAFKEYVLKKR